MNIKFHEAVAEIINTVFFYMLHILKKQTFSIDICGEEKSISAD